jgi:uncharacterized protein (DUF433 family)
MSRWSGFKRRAGGYSLDGAAARAHIRVMGQPVIVRSNDVMGGMPVFYGTRVPVQTLLDYLEAGETIDDFLEGFPSVTLNLVIAFPEEAKDRPVKSFSLEDLRGASVAL